MSCAHKMMIVSAWKARGTFNGLRRIRWCRRCGVLFDEYDHDSGKTWRFRYAHPGSTTGPHKMKPWRKS